MHGWVTALLTEVIPTVRGVNWAIRWGVILPWGLEAGGAVLVGSIGVKRPSLSHWRSCSGLEVIGVSQEPVKGFFTLSGT